MRLRQSALAVSSENTTADVLCRQNPVRESQHQGDHRKKIPSKVYEAVLAGKGLEAWYLYQNIPAGADPLGPDNILGFAAGALCGTGAFLTGRWTVACKSSLTGGWGDANCGGLFAPAVVKLPARMQGDPPLSSGPLKGIRLHNREPEDGDVVGFFFPVSGG